MKTKLIFTINGIIHIIMGSFLWIGANIIGKPFTNNSFQLKAPGENLTDGIHMVIASTVDTVGAFNIGIGLMLLIIRNINDLLSEQIFHKEYRFRTSLILACCEIFRIIFRTDYSILSIFCIYQIK